MQLHKDTEGKMYYLKDRKRVYTTKTPLRGNVTKSRSPSRKPTRKASRGRPRGRSPTSPLFGRVRKSKDNPCSLRNRNNCADDPACHYVTKRGCMRSPRYKLTKKSGYKPMKSLVYEGPVRPVDYMSDKYYRKDVDL